MEAVKDPSLKGKAVAVCGNEDERHGIVLAKSQKAKIMGIKTGDTVLEARRKCNDLIVVRPDFDSYFMYSERVKEIYKRYTDLVEPFGMDECWLDVTGSKMLFGSGRTIADKLRRTVYAETGLTISVGVSFNKVFAKLGSDMKKPDATTVISKEGFKSMLKNVPADALLFVGRRTFDTLKKYGIYTIGGIASAEPDFMRKILGKNGFELWLYANGMDSSPVSHYNAHTTVKSVSRGITCNENLFSNSEVQRVIAELSVKVSKNLRRERLLACGVQLSLKDDSLCVRQYGDLLDYPTHSAKDIFNAASALLSEKYGWNRAVRSVTVRTYNLVPENSFIQLKIDADISRYEKREKIDETLVNIRKYLGGDAVFNGCRLLGTKMPAGKSEHGSLPPAANC